MIIFYFPVCFRCYYSEKESQPMTAYVKRFFEPWNSQRTKTETKNDWTTSANASYYSNYLYLITYIWLPFREPLVCQLWVIMQVWTATSGVKLRSNSIRVSLVLLLQQSHLGWGSTKVSWEAIIKEERREGYLISPIFFRTHFCTRHSHFTSYHVKSIRIKFHYIY